MNIFPVLASDFVKRYRVHLLVFFVVIFIGLTFTHPELLLTDEWITVNQLHQLHDGHQILTNEGKYGFFENGTPNAYFAARGNRLGYSLFLPLLSLPALWLVDFFGDHFSFFILNLWTLVLLLLLLSLHYWYPRYSCLGQWQWTPEAIGITFFLFFVNLFYYVPYHVNDPDSFPEITAVVFTNIILLAIAGMLLYEINRTIFGEIQFSFFGTIVCLFSSSYVFWATGCKDHILTVLIFTSILLCIIKLQKTADYWYLSLAFLLTGLLAWARPEFALWVFFFICGTWGYSFARQVRKNPVKDLVFMISLPFFTVVGALPFFLNNLLISKNPLLPPNTLYFSEDAVTIAVTNVPSTPMGTNMPTTSLYQIITMKNTLSSPDILGDSLGILFHPANGSMGVLSLTPFFLVMVILATILVLAKKMQFSREDLQIMAVIAFMTVPVFLAYASNLPQLNASRGITPDIRYLVPVYIPLNLLGLIIMRRTQITNESPAGILKKMIVFSAIGIPIALYLTASAYTNPEVVLKLDAPVSSAFSACIFLLVAVALIILLRISLTKCSDGISGSVIALLCAFPFIWQIDISVRFWLFGATNQGYAAWIPVINAIYTFLSSPLLVH